MQQISPNNLINGKTYYIEHFGPHGSLTKNRGTATRITNDLFHFDNVIEYVNGQETPRSSFYAPITMSRPNATYYWQFYKPVAEDLMTKQVLRGLGVDKETSWGLHKHHINPHIGRGGKRKTRSKRAGYDSGRDDNRLSKEWIEHILHFYYDQEDISDKISRDDLKEILKKLKYDEDYRCPITGEPIKIFGYQAMAKVDAFLKYGDHIGGKRKTKKSKKSKRKNRKTRSKKGGVKMTKPKNSREKANPTKDRKELLAELLFAVYDPIKDNKPSLNRAFPKTYYPEERIRNMSSEEQKERYRQWRNKEADTRSNLRYAKRKSEEDTKRAQTIKNQKLRSHIPDTIKTEKEKTGENNYFPESYDPTMDYELLKYAEVKHIPNHIPNKEIEYTTEPSKTSNPEETKSKFGQARPRTILYDLDKEAAARIWLNMKNTESESKSDSGELESKSDSGESESKFDPSLSFVDGINGGKRKTKRNFKKSKKSNKKIRKTRRK